MNDIVHGVDELAKLNPSSTLDKEVNHDNELVILVERLVALELGEEAHSIITAQHHHVHVCNSLKFALNEGHITVEGTDNACTYISGLDLRVRPAHVLLEKALDLSDGDLTPPILVKSVENLLLDSHGDLYYVEGPDSMREFFS